MQRHGFTIVELLIVIVVIGILASVGIATYSGVTRQADNRSRLVELKQWQKLFELYKIQFGEYPPMPRGTDTIPISYCLGKGFPLGADGAPRCRDFAWACDQAINSACTSFLESQSDGLATELSKVGRVSAVQKKPISGTVGPYVEYYTWGISLVNWLEGSGAEDCPEDFHFTWTDGKRVSCVMFIDD